MLYADELRRRGYELEARREPFFPERVLKSEDEIEEMKRLSRINERAIDSAIGLIAGSTRGEGGVLVVDGKVLTAEDVKKRLNLVFLEQGRALTL